MAQAKNHHEINHHSGKHIESTKHLKKHDHKREVTKHHSRHEVEKRHSKHEVEKRHKHKASERLSKRERLKKEREDYRASRKKSRHKVVYTYNKRHHSQGYAERKNRNRSKMRETSWLEHAQEGQLKMTGKASWYGKDFHGGPTASGIKYDMYTFTAAHRTLPMGTVVKVTTQDSGKSVMVCVTDRGPYVRGRIIDLSYAAASQLDLKTKGVGDVKLEVVSDSKGTPLKPKQAFYVEYKAARGQQKAGPYKNFSNASAMHEALRQAHPEAKIILADK